MQSQEQPALPASPSVWLQALSPAAVFSHTGNLVIGFGIAAALFFSAAAYIALFALPAGAHWNEAYRIVFIHLPAQWTALLICALLGMAAAARMAGLRWCAPLPAALAPTGALFALLALCSGSLWGRPTAGLWWTWDARLAAEITLLGLYLVLMAVHAMAEEESRLHRLAGMLAIAGLGVLPLFHSTAFLMHYEGSLGGALSRATVTAGMSSMVLAALAYTMAAVLLRLQCLALERQRTPDWCNGEGA